MFIPELKTKIRTALVIADPTTIPAVERQLWGLRLWQVVGLFFLGTIVLGKGLITVIRNAPTVATGA